MEKLDELLNVLKNCLIKIEKSGDYSIIDAAHMDAFDRVYDMSLIKFKNLSVLYFKGNTKKQTYVSCLKDSGNYERFCDDIEKRIIGSN